MTAGRQATVIPVILCGGSGTRLWPLSRELYPKQLLVVEGEHSLLQDTLRRLDGLGLAAPLLVSNEEQRFLVAEQLRQAGIAHQGLMLEPAGRNTAPALAIAALRALAVDADPVLLVLPADHVIHDVAAFHAAVRSAVALAQQGRLVTFGIVPDCAETGYGYIRRGEAAGEGAFRVAAFVEKPDAKTAQQYLDSGEYDWNSGMFVLGAHAFLRELEQFRPDILAACRRAIDGLRTDGDFLRVDAAAFRECPEDSIDYAVMERTQQAVVVPLAAGWSDVGSFQALWEIADKDGEGNAVRGDVLLQKSRNCYVQSESRLVATLGVEDLVIVETADAVLVARRDTVQGVKGIVQRIRELGRPEAQQPFRVNRPWGYYESVDEGERHQVKRIGVRPGASLSLQMHYHRAEHWIVVKGTAEVTCDERVFLVEENQSTFIPLGHRHRLRNPGKVWLEIVEVQSGAYLGEDDIVRFDDNYGRA